MRTRLFLVVMLMGVFLWSVSLPLALAQEGTTVIVTTQPDRPTGSFALEMPAADISATYALYLVAEAAQDNVSLSSYLQDSNQQVLANVSIDFLTASGEPLTNINIPAGQTRIGMRINNLTQRGTFTGTIGLQSAANPIGFTPAATFTLVHPPHAQIRVELADAQNVIALQATSPDFYYPLTVLETGGQSAADLRLTLGPVTRRDAVVGQPAELHFEATNAVTADLVVPSGNYAVATVTGTLPEQTGYASWLMVQQGDQITIYTLNISRSAAGGVVALDAVNGQVSLPVSTANFDRVLMFQVANNQPAINDLVIALTQPPLRSDGQPVISETLTCSDCTRTALSTLQPGQIFTLTVSGRYFQATTYSAPLRLSYQGQTQSVPLSITRFQSKQTFTLTSPVSATGTSFVAGGYVDIDTQIADATGVDTQLYYPSSEGAQLLRKDESGRFVTWTPAPTETFLLPANGSAAFTLRWTGLEPGAYTHPIYVAGPNSAPVVQNVTLNVRDSIFLAFAAILAGVLASYWIQRRTRVGRTRDLRSAEIARLRQTLQAQTSDSIWTELLARLERLEWDNRLRTDLTDDALAAALTDVHNRAENYRQALVADKRTKELLDAFPIQTSDLQKIKHEFDQERLRLRQGIEAAVLMPEKQGLGDAAADAPPQVKKLFVLFDDIRKAAILKPTEALLTQLDKLATQAKDDLYLTGKIKQCQTDATSIKTDLEAGKIDGLTNRLEAARQDYAALQLRTLEHALKRLEADRTTAPYATPQDWHTVDGPIAQTRAALQRASKLTTADEQLRVWEEARHDYSLALIAQLAVLISPAGRPRSCTEETWQKAVKATSVLSQFEEAQKAAQGNQWELAEEWYQKAREEYVNVQAGLLKVKIDAFKVLFNQAPQGLEADWGTALTSLKPLLDKFQQLTIVPAQLTNARLEFVKVQIEVWNALHSWATGHFQASLPPNWQARHTTVAEADTARLAYETSRQTKEDVQPLITAEEKLTEVQQQYQSVRAASFGRTSAAGVMEDVLESLGGAVRNLIEAAGDLVVIPAQGLLVQLATYEPSAARTPKDWYRQVERADRLQAVLVLIVATITGLVALWVNNPTFGGTSYLFAVLWGFTLNQAAQSFLQIASDNGALPK